ncbi:MAG: 3-alpha-(or 20-beta)-hydroxysteroid dehydrogenase [Caulobacter sp.]|nr:3-alpha-(or 20-beta)-hydroxysteroid dehydrogenase [Caulobacter sp.]
MNRMEGRSALVTGAARGIGAAIAKAFADEGAKVFIADILEEEGRATAAVLGPNVAYVKLDVTDEGSWAQAVESAEAAHGPLSVLVNNAGLIGPGLMDELDPAMWRRVLDVNLTGVWLGMRAALPSMKKAGGGAMMNISSIAGLVGYPNRAAYVASKWGVRGLTKTAALEYGRFGIRVNSIHPGPIRTQLTAAFPDDTWANQAIPRFGEPEEVGKLAVFLAVDATYSTAAEFVIDGGIIAGLALKSEA